MFVNLRKYDEFSIGLVAFVLAGAAAVGFGVLGIGRYDGAFAHGQANFSHGQADLRYLYAAGRCLAGGFDPYNKTFFASCGQGWNLDGGYVYPPQAGLLAILLSSLSYPWARVAKIALDLACVASLAVLFTMPPKCSTDLGVPNPAPNERWFMSALILGNPFTLLVIWMGQTTLIVAACLAGGWVWLRRGYAWFGGVLIALGTIKPQFAILVALWFILERRMKALAIMAAFIFIMSLPAMVAGGPVGAFTGWLSAADEYYRMNPYNAPGFIRNFSIQNFLATVGIYVPPLLPIGVVATLILWRYRKHINDRDVLPLLVSLALLFGVSHDYDVSILILLLPAFWAHLRTTNLGILVAVSLTVALFLPQRLFWDTTHIMAPSVGLKDALLTQYRVLIALTLMAWLAALTIRHFVDIRSPLNGTTSPVKIAPAKSAI